MSAGDDVHYFDGPGIEEGMGAVPMWFIGFVGLLTVVIIAYLGVYLVGAQPSSAQIVNEKPAETVPATTPPEPATDAAGN